METRIQKTLSQWFPNAFVEDKKETLYSDYEILNHFAKYTQNLIKEDSDNKEEPFKIINLLYSKGTLYERNAIENEFLVTIAFDENPFSLKDHLKLMPKELKEIYIKIIIEN